MNDTPLQADRDMAYRQLFRYAEDLHRLMKEHAWALEELQLARRETLFRLALAAERNAQGDPGVMLRVGILSALTARILGMDENYCDCIAIAAPLRDIGMVGDPRQHPVTGAAILGGGYSEELRMAEDIALTHHEQFDGQGWPAGLAHADIPVSGRIVAVTEALDALYAGGRVEHAADYLQAGAGNRYDPRVVDAALLCADAWLQVADLVTRGLAEESETSITQQLPAMWRQCLDATRQ